MCMNFIFGIILTTSRVNLSVSENVPNIPNYDLVFLSVLAKFQSPHQLTHEYVNAAVGNEDISNDYQEVLGTGERTNGVYL